MRLFPGLKSSIRQEPSVFKITNFFQFSQNPLKVRQNRNDFFKPTKRNLYKDLPERSGGSIIVCNKCRVTKNYFWEKKGFLLNRFFSIWYLFWEYFYFEKIIYNSKRYALKKKLFQIKFLSQERFFSKRGSQKRFFSKRGFLTSQQHCIIGLLIITNVASL